MSKQLKNSLLLLLTALIWGISFVSQSTGGDAIGPFSFNSIRCLIGSAVLLPVIAFRDRGGKNDRQPRTPEQRKFLWTGGIFCGIALFIASNFQQVGIYMGTEAGKAGFLTTFYILLVPILGLFFHKKCGWNIWAGVALSLVGLFLLCIRDNFSLRPSDMVVLVCSLFFSIQILIVDYYSPQVDGVRLASIEFFICGVMGLVPTLVLEMKPWAGGMHTWLMNLTGVGAWIALLYSGVMSCGVAYTLQIVAQDGLNPTIASLLMSLESVFSVLAGAVLLSEFLTGRETIGCVLVFAAVILAQLPLDQSMRNAE